MSSLVPYGRNRNRELSPFQIMRSFFDDPFFSDLGLTTYSSWGGIRADVKDNGNEYLVEADMPGIPKDKINLDVNNGVLTISANEESEQKEEKSNYIYRERRWGSVSRSFSLENIDENNINAEYKDGVLLVHLPKKEQVKKTNRKIDIN